MKNPRPLIAIMAKAPRPGLVKTRLGPLLSGDECAALAACLIADSVAKAKAIGVHVLVAYSPADAADEFSRFAKPRNGVRFQAQIDDEDLGARMSAVFAHAAAAGFSPVVMIGTDSPAMPPRILAEAVAAFDDPATDIVLGPARDGGYYLIALRARPEASLFEGVEWSSATVFATTFANAARIFRTPPVVLETLDDLDTPADLVALTAAHADDPKILESAPETAKWLSSRTDR